MTISTTFSEARKRADTRLASIQKPKLLSVAPAIALECNADDRRVTAAAVRFSRLCQPRQAASFIARSCGEAIPGLQLVFGEEGRLRVQFVYPVVDAPKQTAVAEQVMEWLLRSALEALGLVGAYVVLSNLSDAGLDEVVARNYARRVFRQFEELIAINAAWTNLALVPKV